MKYTRAELIRLEQVKQQRAYELGRALDEHATKRAKRIALAIEGIDKDLDLELGPGIKSSRDHLATASDTYLDYLVAYKSQPEVSDVPIGTVFVKWIKSTPTSFGILRPTIASAVLEVFTPTSSGSASADQPQVGEYILRHCKKDGTPTGDITRSVFGLADCFWFGSYWYPKGVDANQWAAERKLLHLAIFDDNTRLAARLVAAPSEGSWVIERGVSNTTFWQLENGNYLDSGVTTSDQGHRFPTQEAAQQLIDAHPLTLKGSRPVMVPNKD